MKVFIDTSAFCALTIPKDKYNPRAKILYNQIVERNAIIFSSNYILDETYTLLKSRSSHDTSIKFMDNIGKCHITILNIDEDIENSAKKIFKKFKDKKLSFTDCTSFALINQFNINAAFAFDEHFRYHPYSHPVECWK
ncbi:MAG: PIN domain-containing protein [Maribacter sp.]|nr:PIN domain-containing protein [Maribacter sp.]